MLDHEASPDDLLESSHGFVFAAPAYRADAIELERAADDGSSPQQLAGNLRQRRQPGLQQIPYASRQRPLLALIARGQGGQVLHHKERKPVGLGIETVDEVWGRFGSDGGHDLGRLRAAQPLQGDRRSRPRQGRLREHQVQPVAGRHLLATPRRQHQQRPFAHAMQEKGQEIE